MFYDANSPIWLQVADAIKTDIVTGRRAPGDKLPGGRDIALQYAINPNTAARVYKELENERLVETRRGMGTFVTEDRERISALKQQMAEKAVHEFITKMRKLGVSPEEAAQMLAQEDKNA